MKVIKELIKKIIGNLHMPNNQRGVVLPIILMAIGGLSLIGAAAISVSTGEIGIANNDKMYKAALNLAEAGISDANDGIQGNRALIPQPIGSVMSASYTFNTALASGRYQVTVELPVVTAVSSFPLAGASSVAVADITKLGPGNTIIIGNTDIHMMAQIGSITQPGNILNLIDSRNRPYLLPYDVTADMKVARNLISITSLGQTGTGLTGGTPTAWRSNPAGLGNTQLPAGGIVRSTATIQAQYTMQEIQILSQFTATGTLPNAPVGKFNGPILVTNSLDVNNYQKNDYSGPIFISGAATATINGTSLPSTNSFFPKAVKIPAVAVNAGTMLANAQNNATCYQKQCTNASGTQQIYYLNGYKVDVKTYRPPVAGNGFQLNIDDTQVDITGTKLIVYVSYPPMTLGSSENVQLTKNATNPADPTAPASFSPIIPTAVTPSDAKVTWGGTNANIKFDPGVYVAGTIQITFNLSNISWPGTYIRLYDNSNNSPGFGPNKVMSNGVWTTPLGNIESQVYQGDLNIYNDSGAGSHANHSTILTTAPSTWYNGGYATSDTASATATAPTTNGEGAILFGGRRMGATWTVGDTASYWTTYYIHTNAVGNCNDHDIAIKAYTKVTYLGTSNKCSGTDNRMLFLYETVWNHTGTNNADSGLQGDDNDPKLGNTTIPNMTSHKGYYKWVRERDYTGGDANHIMKGVEPLLGDKEFNSVFNHSSANRFQSAVVNTNISRIRMIGWTNPPVAYGSSTMNVSPMSFATWPNTPANSSSWDWVDMIGNRSSFPSSGALNGFDFADFTIASGSVVPYVQGNDAVLPDATGAPGSNSFNLHRATSLPAELGLGHTWSGPTSQAMPGAGAAIMDPSQLPSTVITATISGPYFTRFEIRRGSANLFFDAANGIPFNIKELSVETKGGGANITIGSATNPATVFAGQFKLESESCAGSINFNFTGKMVSNEVEFEKNVQYNIDTTLSNAATCLSSGQNYIYLRKQSWREIRN